MKWDVLSVARGILDPDTGKYLGMIVIDCSVDNFAKLWDASEYSESIIAVSDKNGKLILPGGESTVMRKLLLELDIYDALKEKILSGLPVFGTCAGLILLADEVEAGVPCFGTMNITAKRNAYGRQLGSFHTDAEFDGLGQVPMTFIRAPYIAQAREGVEILAEVDGKIAAARQGRQLVTAFHPELDGDTRIHEYFLNM